MHITGNTNRRLCLFITILLLYPSIFLAQVTTDYQIKSGYIYNFTKYFNWEKENKIDTFRIGIYGEETEFIHVLKSMENLKAKNKPIKITTFKSIADISFTHILLVTNDRNYMVKDISELLRFKNTLMVTDRCQYQRYVMVNFIYNPDSKITFEINSKNLEEAKFQINPKLILLGGSEIDVRKLYLETEKSLLTEKEKVEFFEKELKQKKQEIESLNSQVVSYNREIENLQRSITFQKKELNDLQQLSSEQQKNLEDQSLILNIHKLDIQAKEKLIAEKNKEIASKQENISKYGQILSSQKAEIEKRQNIIKQQEESVITLIERIKNQQTILYMLIALVLMAVALILVIYRNFKINKTRNLEIERQSEQLYHQTLKLTELNEELVLKKNNLEEALEKLKNTQTQLVESEKMVILGQLTAGIAHEINNPVNFINSGIEFLKIAYDQIFSLLGKYEQLTAENARKELLHIENYKNDIDYKSLINDIDQVILDIKSGVNRTVEIVKSLRTFTRLDESDLKTIDLHHSIDSTLIILKNKYSNRIEIIKNYDPQIPQIECYPGKINQLLLNILVNAIQAITDTGQIFITTKLRTINELNFAELSIKDTGIGIPEHIKKKIFEPFFTTKEIGEGTGLGLSISKSIVEEHFGSLNVETEIDKGSTFSILLPVIFKKIK